MSTSLVTPGATYTLTSKATNTVVDYSQRDFKVRSDDFLEETTWKADWSLSSYAMRLNELTSQTVTDFFARRSIIGYTLHGGTNQQWIFEDAGNGLFYIKSGKGVYLTYSGTPASLTPFLGTSAKQAWKVVADSVDSSCIKVLHPTEQLCMDLTGSSALLETKIILYTIHTGRNQAWKLTRIAPPVGMFDPYFAPAFFLVNLYTRTVADASSTGVTGRTNAKQANQVWLTEPSDVSKNLYFIKSAADGQYLSISGAPSTSKPVGVSANKQAWQIRPDANDPQLVKIYYPDSDFLLDLTASNSAQGTPIIVYPTQNPGLNQQWKIQAAT